MTTLLIDGNGLVCRLWWANAYEVPERFSGVVRRLVDQLGADEAFVAWDYPGPGIRREVMPEYKAGRGPKPEALEKALVSCQALDLPHRRAKGYEADDVIATLAAEALGLVYILTDDKDMAQLVCDERMLVNAAGKVTNADAVEQRWGVPPDRIRYLLSWTGDRVDGLPGVDGVGRKRGRPKAMNYEVGDELTFDLIGLMEIPSAEMEAW